MALANTKAKCRLRRSLQGCAGNLVPRPAPSIGRSDAWASGNPVLIATDKRATMHEVALTTLAPGPMPNRLTMVGGVLI